MIPRRKAALHLMVRALDVLASDSRAIELHTKADAARGDPPFEARTDAYREEAEALARAFRRHVAKVGVFDWPTYERELDRLEQDLMALVEQRIPQAFRLGYNRRTLDPAAQMQLAQLVQRERMRVQSKLIPFARAVVQGSKQEPFEDPDFTIGVQVGVHLEIVDGAASGMGGGYWSAIFAGLAAAADALGPVPVRRLLNPLAHHCDTCPPKAREYGSMDEMLAITGGFPGDGSDACFSNCRCRCQIYQDGLWRDLVEWG